MHSGIDVLDRTVQQTNQWLDDVAALIDAPDRQLAYQALRAVLHALRDRIAADDAAHLAAQFPLLVRGIFYDDYRVDTGPETRAAAPSATLDPRAAFLERLDRSVFRGLEMQPERVARAVFKVIAGHIDPPELEKLARRFPEDLRDLWPDLPNLPQPPAAAWPAEPPRSGSRGGERSSSGRGPTRRGSRKTGAGSANRR